METKNSKERVAEMNDKRNGKADYRWVEFYMNFANILLQFKNNRSDLIEKIRKVYSNIDLKLPKLERDNDIVDIDPFTVFALFNKRITDDNRIKF